MGLGWILEIIAWIIVKSKATIPNQFTFIMLIITECQGIVVFMVFGLKRSNRHFMKSKVNEFMTSHYTVANTTHEETELTTLNKSRSATN